MKEKSLYINKDHQLMNPYICNQEAESWLAGFSPEWVSIILVCHSAEYLLFSISTISKQMALSVSGNCLPQSINWTLHHHGFSSQLIKQQGFLNISWPLLYKAKVKVLQWSLCTDVNLIRHSVYCSTPFSAQSVRMPNISPNCSITLQPSQ